MLKLLILMVGWCSIKDRDQQVGDVFLPYFLDVSQRRPGRERLAPFRVERLDYRTQDQERFYEGLARNGPKAVCKFAEAFSQ